MVEQTFEPISLADLNGKAEMLTRLDNKYVVPFEALIALAPEFAKDFDILEIDGKRNFGYLTQYYDTPNFCSFRHHIQGRRRRSKVRTRYYLDADICFLEVKLKSQRKITEKKRLNYKSEDLSRLTETGLQFVETSHQTCYGTGALGSYVPVMQMRYERLTLVAKSGGERLTIDRNLQFWNKESSEEISREMVVIETKSAFGRGIADTILRRALFHPIGSCSKYCVGLAALNLVPRFNKFLPAFRRLLPQLSNGESVKSTALVAQGCISEGISLPQLKAAA